jgi:hypothetical protein
LVELGGRVMPVPAAAAVGITAQRSGDTLSTIIRRPASSITSGHDLAALARDDMINARALLDLDAPRSESGGGRPLDQTAARTRAVSEQLEQVPTAVSDGNGLATGV